MAGKVVLNEDKRYCKVFQLGYGVAREVRRPVNGCGAGSSHTASAVFDAPQPCSLRNLSDS